MRRCSRSSTDTSTACTSSSETPAAPTPCPASRRGSPPRCGRSSRRDRRPKRCPSRAARHTGQPGAAGPILSSLRGAHHRGDLVRIGPGFLSAPRPIPSRGTAAGRSAPGRWWRRASGPGRRSRGNTRSAAGGFPRGNPQAVLRHRAEIGVKKQPRRLAERDPEHAGAEADAGDAVEVVQQARGESGWTWLRKMIFQPSRAMASSRAAHLRCLKNSLLHPAAAELAAEEKGDGRAGDIADEIQREAPPEPEEKARCRSRARRRGAAAHCRRRRAADKGPRPRTPSRRSSAGGRCNRHREVLGEPATMPRARARPASWRNRARLELGHRGKRGARVEATAADKDGRVDHEEEIRPLPKARRQTQRCARANPAAAAKQPRTAPSRAPGVGGQNASGEHG